MTSAPGSSMASAETGRERIVMPRRRDGRSPSIMPLDSEISRSFFTFVKRVKRNRSAALSARRHRASDTRRSSRRRRSAGSDGTGSAGSARPGTAAPRDRRSRDSRRAASPSAVISPTPRPWQPTTATRPGSGSWICGRWSGVIATRPNQRRSIGDAGQRRIEPQHARARRCAQSSALLGSAMRPRPPSTSRPSGSCGSRRGCAGSRRPPALRAGSRGEIGRQRRGGDLEGMQRHDRLARGRGSGRRNRRWWRRRPTSPAVPCRLRSQSASRRPRGAAAIARVSCSAMRAPAAVGDARQLQRVGERIDGAGPAVEPAADIAAVRRSARAISAASSRRDIGAARPPLPVALLGGRAARSRYAPPGSSHCGRCGTAELFRSDQVEDRVGGGGGEVDQRLAALVAEHARAAIPGSYFRPGMTWPPFSPDAPSPILPASRTRTESPSRAACSAVERPMMPPPTIARSTCSPGCSGSCSDAARRGRRPDRRGKRGGIHDGSAELIMLKSISPISGF